MRPARRQVRGLTVTSALVAALALATYACSDGRTGPTEPDGAAFATTPDLDRAGRRIVVTRDAVAAYREAGEITQQSIADQLRRRLNEAHEGVARNRVPDAIQALNRFIALINAETPASISPAAAAALIAHARDILAMLGGSAANQLPSATITAPPDGATFDVGDAVTFTGTGTDPEDGDLTGAALVWTSSIDGQIGTGTSFMRNDLSQGTHTITLTVTDSKGLSDTDEVDIAVEAEPNQPPTADITAPPDGATFDVGDAITFTGTCTDPEGGDLTGESCAWTSSIDGDIGIGPSPPLVSDLSEGTHTITLTATDSHGATDTDQIAITIDGPDNQAPTADITAPPDGTKFDVGAAITFTGTGTDPEDGDLTGAALVWTSSIDGQIGTGTSFMRNDLSQGTHTITLTVTDSEGLKDTDEVDITVEVEPNQPPAADITAPPDGAMFDVGDAITFTGTGTDPEDGDLTGAALVWTSSIDGQVGTGTSFMRNNLSAGTHTITLTATDSKGLTGTDAIDVIIMPDAPPACGIILSGTIGQAGQVNVHSFPGAAGDDVLFTFVETGGFGGLGVAPRATILAPSGNVLATFDANTQRRDTLTESGTYSIRVNANNLVSTGTYSLGFECLFPLGPIQGTLASGEIFPGTISVPAQVDLIAFSGEAGDEILLTFVETAGFGGLGVAPRLTILAPSGAVVATFDANAQRRHTLPETGEFIIYVRPNNLVTTGSYNLGLESLDPLGPNQGDLISGGIHSGSIVDPAEVDLIAFAGEAGDDILLTFVETAGFGGLGVAPRLTIVAPSGAVVSTFDANTQQRDTLPETGQYIVHIQPNNLVTTGSYNLGLESLIPLGPNQGPIACNAGPVPGTLDTSGQVDLKTFAGSAGGTVTFTFVETAGFGGLGVAPRATVVAPSGAVVATFDANAQQTHVLAETGVHTIYFRANNLVATGDYSMTLTCS